ncbi:hypothetical protein QJS04_geneDACA015228 [Acorus gramineus]|uniref:Replication factor A C-terminal domain-containing protein n=1 Tax=Acorus gramineus TaxID=55184 RepID=A0AAV9B8G9_ACOGR|nr:hypothetical protein QJS04_geneDACA015228 [Acorus gramineus]
MVIKEKFGGKMIQDTLFDDDIKLFDGLLNMRSVYYISNTRITKIDPRYRCVDNDYQLIFHQGTIVEELSEDLLHCQKNDVIHRLKATITRVLSDSDFWYMSCNRCAKKTTHTYQTNFHCGLCDFKICVATPRYLLKIKLTDSSSSAWVTLFGDVVENLLGCKLDDLIQFDNMKKKYGGLIPSAGIVWLYRIITEDNREE